MTLDQFSNCGCSVAEVCRWSGCEHDNPRGCCPDIELRLCPRHAEAVGRDVAPLYPAIIQVKGCFEREQGWRQKAQQFEQERDSLREQLKAAEGALRDIADGDCPSCGCEKHAREALGGK